MVFSILQLVRQKPQASRGVRVAHVEVVEDICSVGIKSIYLAHFPIIFNAHLYPNRKTSIPVIWLDKILTKVVIERYNAQPICTLDAKSTIVGLGELDSGIW